MNTIISLAVGIYLGRQYTRIVERHHIHSEVKKKLIDLLQSNGLSVADAEKQAEKIFS